jgi:D-3-phosphoglycerate dehydrogenase
MDAMPNLHVVGVSRAGVENVNIAEATKRGILVFNVEGRNAEAVSDFAVGMMLCEARNIARAHYSIKSGQWRKTFSNSDFVPEFKDRTIGLVGFGYIGRLVARKLSGFNVNILVHDPFVPAEDIKALGATPVDKEQLFKESDFISVHARLTEDTKKYIGKKELSVMKKTAYFINTARAGLVDQDALAQVLQNNQIAGAALDVFTNEPIDQDSPFLSLDNVTLTTHIAGTTADALNNSPGLLMEDIARLMNGQKARFIKNPQVLDDPNFQAWLREVTA